MLKVANYKSLLEKGINTKGVEYREIYRNAQFHSARWNFFCITILKSLHIYNRGTKVGNLSFRGLKSITIILFVRLIEWILIEDPSSI